MTNVISGERDSPIRLNSLPLSCHTNAMRRLLRMNLPYMLDLLSRLWSDEDGQDIAEYAMMFAVVLAMVMSVTRAIGSHASAVFSRIASSIH
jgi:Flp pilus assembly pilin Flp